MRALDPREVEGWCILAPLHARFICSFLRWWPDVHSPATDTGPHTVGARLYTRLPYWNRGHTDTGHTRQWHRYQDGAGEWVQCRTDTRGNTRLYPTAVR